MNKYYTKLLKKKHYFTAKLILLLLTISAVFPKHIMAVNTGIAINGKTSFTGGYAEYIGDIYNFSLKLGSAIVVLMMIYAGIKYMTSQGNPSVINEAKDIIIGSLSGLAFLILAYFILKTLNMPVTNS